MPPGHARRIVLWKPNSTATSDAAGIDVIDVKSAPKEYFQEGPYAAAANDQRPTTRSATVGVPSLQLICLTKARKLLELREDWREVLTDVMPAWRNHITTYEAVVKSRSVEHLLPGVDPASITPLQRVDPLTWALVIQLIPDLPSRFRCYEIALSDAHVPLLQHIPDSKQFCIITVLNLEGCPHLTDDTISNLKDLHGLIALNASRCMGLSSTAIIRLRNALVRDHDERGVSRRGPWRLRILWLRGCRGLNSNVFAELEKFPLLSVIDLTGTGCYNRGDTPFQTAITAQLKLYHPVHLLDATSALVSAKGVLPSRNQFSLYIDQLHPPATRPARAHQPIVKEEDGFVVLSKHSMRHGRLPSENIERKPHKANDRKPAHLIPYHGELFEDFDSEEVANYFSNPAERFDAWMRESGESGESGDDDEDESNSDVDRQNAGRFYGTTLPQSDADAIFLRKMAAFAPTKDEPNASDQRLNPLMLYRKPPPYNAIFKPSPTSIRNRDPSHHSEFEVAGAPANRALPHVKAALESLGKLNKQLARKQVSAVVRPADGFGMANIVDSKTPRNPFLAKSRRPMPDFGSPSAPSSSTPSPRLVPSDLSNVDGEKRHVPRTSSAAAIDQTTIPILTPPSPESEPRPLRGISTLAVPLPPPPKKRPRTSSRLGPGKKAKTATLDPALTAPTPKHKGTGLRPMTSASLRQKMVEQQKRAGEDRDVMLAPEKKERRKSTGSVKPSGSSTKPRERTSTAGGGLDAYFKRS